MQCAACGVVQKLFRKIRPSSAPFAFKEERLLRELGTANPATLEQAFAMLPRERGNCLDYLPLAALAQGGYVEISISQNDEDIDKVFDWSSALCLFAEEDTSAVGPCIALTAKGMLKIEELDSKEEARQVRRKGYFINLMVALIAGIAGAWAKTHLIDPAERPPAILAPEPQHVLSHPGAPLKPSGELR